MAHVSEDCSLSQQEKKIGPLQFLEERLLAIVGMYPELVITCDQASFKWGEWETNPATYTYTYTICPDYDMCLGKGGLEIEGVASQ